MSRCTNRLTELLAGCGVFCELPEAVWLLPLEKNPRMSPPCGFAGALTFPGAISICERGRANDEATQGCGGGRPGRRATASHVDASRDA